MKRFRDFVLRNFALKVISLAAALALWFVGVNMNNPVQNHIVRQRVHLDNMGVLGFEDLLLLNEAEMREALIQVGIRSYRSELDALRAAELGDTALFDDMVGLSVDFRAISSEAVRAADGALAVRLPVSPNLYHGLEHFSIRPSYVYALVDAVERRSVNVEVDVAGDAADGLWLESVELVNGRVTLSGARTVVREVESVRARVDISGLAGSADVPVEIRAYGRDGDITEHVRLSATATSAEVALWPVRQLPVRVEFAGAAAPGFAVHSYFADQEHLTVAAESFDGLDELVFQVELGDAGANTAVAVPVAESLPDGVALVSGRPQLYVTVNVEPLESRALAVPRRNLRVSGVEAIYQILTDAQVFHITVRGPRSAVQAVEPGDVFLDLDLAGFPAGTHTARLAATLPDGVALVSAAPSVAFNIEVPAAPQEDGAPEDRE